jgi:hypothetical protein
MDVRTQGSGANAATLGFIPLPRWGILDGKRGLYPIAGGPGVGIGIGIAPVELGGHSQFAPSVLVGGSSHQPRGRCGQAALRMGFRSPERATHTSPGGATGTVPPRWTRDHRPTPQPTAHSPQPTGPGRQAPVRSLRPVRSVRLGVGVGIGIGIAPVELGGHSQLAPSILVGRSSRRPTGRWGQAPGRGEAGRDSVRWEGTPVA